MAIARRAILIACVFAVGAACYFAFTDRGSDFIVRPILANYTGAVDITVNKSSGSLSNTLAYQGIELNNLKWLPEGNSVKIQRLDISINPFHPQDLDIKIQNGRLKFSGSETIFFYGDYKKGALDISAYTNDVSVRDVLDLFAESAALKKISGSLKDVDINIKGPFLEPELQGSFLVENLSRDGFSMINCLCKLDMKLIDIRDDLRIKGEVLLEKGSISGPKTARIILAESKILFAGDPKTPSLNLKGTSVVEDVKINISLKGTFNNPDLNLTSKPEMGRDRLLLMLATNKKWKSVEALSDNQELSTDIAADFLEYFIFSGSGSKITQRYGIHDISVKYDGTTAGIGAKKDVSDKMTVGYSVEQGQDKGGNPPVSHKAGTEYKITESISIAGEKEIKQNSADEQTQDKPKTDDKVTIKFKKDF